MLTRQPNDVVQVNLRIKEHERRRLEDAARANRTTLNGEIAGRVMRTFEQEGALTNAQLAENVFRYLQPLVKDTHELSKIGDFMRATDVLIALVEPTASDAVTEAIARINTLKGLFDREAGRRMRRVGRTQ
jgi:hypothetical protein